MRFGIISDVHLGYGDDQVVLEALDRTVETVTEGFEPDHVVVLGDLIEDQPDPAADEANLEAVVEVIDGHGVPATYLFGNHDVAQIDPETVSRIVGNDPWGRIPGTECVYLDSSAPRLGDPRGELSADQLGFLDETLPGCRRPVVFVHHPVHYHDITSNPWFGDTPERAFCGNKIVVQNLLADLARSAVTVNGHIHETAYAHADNAHHFTLNAFNKEYPRATGVTGTYGLLTVGDEVTMTATEPDRITRTITVEFPDE